MLGCQREPADPEGGVRWQPSVIIDPFGEVQLFEDPLAVVTLIDPELLKQDRRTRATSPSSATYAQLWKDIPSRQAWPHGEPN